MDEQAGSKRLERDVLARIPLARAMRLCIARYVPNGQLTLAAPLEVSINHEGFGFGGAIECIGTLACWGLVWLTLDHPDAVIVIQHSEMDFLAPIRDELVATARPPADGSWEHFVHAFSAHGKGRIDLAATVGTTEKADCARFQGRFVARHKG